MLVALLLGAAPATALAGKAVVVLGISGPRGGQATSLISGALAGRYRLISRGRFVRAAAEQGKEIGHASGLAAAARALRVAAIIKGNISRVGPRWVLRITVFSGHSGRAVGAKSFPLRGTRVDAGTARRVPTGLAGALAAARAGAPIRGVSAARARRPAPAARRPRRPRPPAVAARAPVVPQPAPQQGGFDDGSDINTSTNDDGDSDSVEVPEERDDPRPIVPAPRPPPVAARGAGGDDLGFEVDDGAADGGAEQGKASEDDGEVPTFRRGRARKAAQTEAEVTQEPQERRSWEKVVELSIGLMAMSRSFDIANPIKPASAAGHSNYRSGLVPALQIEGALYPLVYFNRGPLANLGLIARYYRVLGLKSQQGTSLEPTETTLHTFEAGLRYRWNILDRKTSPTIRAGVDFGRLGFMIHDTNGTIKLPNVAYVYLKLALVGLDVPFYASNTFVIGGMLSFDYLLVFSSGDIERTDSRGYGRSQTGGIDAGLGLFASYHGFFGRLTGFYRRMFYDFEATCVGFTECLGAGGALDVYLGGSLMVGYAF